MILHYKWVDKIKLTVKCKRRVYVNHFPNWSLSKLDSWTLRGRYFGQDIRRNLLVCTSIIFLLWIPLKFRFYGGLNLIALTHTTKTPILERGLVSNTLKTTSFSHSPKVLQIKERGGGLHKSYSCVNMMSCVSKSYVFKTKLKLWSVQILSKTLFTL